jgi:hypothetical protein
MGVNAVVEVALDVLADIASDRPIRSARSSSRFTALRDTVAWLNAVGDLIDREVAAALRRKGEAP